MCALGVLCGTAWAADPAVEPVSVCEVLHDLASLEGKTVAVIGRYSFRQTGRWIAEQSCEPATNEPPQLWLVEDTKDAPRPPEPFEIDALSMRKKFAAITLHTALGKFRFGTPDYDRWAVIYGRVEARKGDDAKKAPANLVIRGNGVIVYVNP
jgi:hypothetical protein